MSVWTVSRSLGALSQDDAFALAVSKSEEGRVRPTKEQQDRQWERQANALSVSLRATIRGQTKDMTVALAAVEMALVSVLAVGAKPGRDELLIQDSVIRIREGVARLRISMNEQPEAMH